MMYPSASGVGGICPGGVEVADGFMDLAGCGRRE
jgi:hypothetical protein